MVHTSGLMGWIIVLVICFVSTSYGYKAPTSEFVDPTAFSESVVGLLQDSAVESIVAHLARSADAQLSSLMKTRDRDELFHLDALYFSIPRSRQSVARLLESRTQEVSDRRVHNLGYEDYENIIRTISRIDEPGVNESHAAARDIAFHSKLYRDNFNIVYVTDIFDDWTLAKLKSEVSRLWTSSDIEPNCNLNGYDRLGGYVHFTSGVPPGDQQSSLYSLIYGNEPLRLWMSAIVGTPLFPADFPIELREYGNHSRGMPCHADVQMYANVSSNIEVVVTLSNHGLCEVSWFDRNNVRHSVRPEANSITLVQPDAAIHCVSDTKGGFREILKFIMVGDYRKHSSFYQYVDNKCSKQNPNVKAVKARRKERSKKVPQPAVSEEL